MDPWYYMTFYALDISLTICSLADDFAAYNI